ncbi:MAG: phosphoglucosamine mutase [Bacteroidetes bacterium 4572_77]|nr:MAG: phosphoglucosamine mutase [Bacteroidetes bacterium 4572_77]
MTLIKSISGFRGTIGGKVGEGLTPVDIVGFASAFASFIYQESGKEAITIVVGRDARLSGEMVEALVNNTLVAMGVHVVNLGLSTTPTVEMAVVNKKADGGIILTASHNPKQWNALKLLNGSGEFISAAQGEALLKTIEHGGLEFKDIDKIGSIVSDDTQIAKHVQEILKLELVNVEAIKKANFKVAFDAVNSTGGISIPVLLDALGVKDIVALYEEPTGIFPHNPEPLPEHLTVISQEVVKQKAHVGFVVDPDVDRLAIVSENGDLFGEEYTLVAVADYILSKKKGATVSNLSSTRALRDVSVKHGVSYSASAVGEVNVVAEMKATNAIIGGEGNGGIIYPELHYGRDSLVGIALFLSLMAEREQKVSKIRSSYPDYFISKNRINLDAEMEVDVILESIAEKYQKEEVSAIDGVKIDFEEGWVHLRKSNTEPILRLYSESNSENTSENLAKKIMNDVGEIIKDRR